MQAAEPKVYGGRGSQDQLCEPHIAAPLAHAGYTGDPNCELDAYLEAEHEFSIFGLIRLRKLQQAQNHKRAR